MNIEEERKAFIKHFPNIGTVIFDSESNVFRTASDSKWQCDVVEYANRIWPVWLVAKAHAEEMAKPTVRIQPKSNFKGSSCPFVLSMFEGETFNGVLEDFCTEDDAKEWAKRNGYRVIE